MGNNKFLFSHILEILNKLMNVTFQNQTSGHKVIEKGIKHKIKKQFSPHHLTIQGDHQTIQHLVKFLVKFAVNQNVKDPLLVFVVWL